MIQRWGVRARVILAAVLPMLALAIALTVFFTSSRLSDLEEAHNARGQALARQLAAASEYAVFSGNIETLQQLANAVFAETDIVSVRILDAHGDVLVRSGYFVQGSGGSPLRAGGEAVHEIVEPITPGKVALDDGFGLDAAPRADSQLGSVYLGMSRTHLLLQRNQLLRGAAGAVLLGLIGSLLLASWLSRGVSRPIRAVAQAVSRIGRGQLGERVPTMGGGSLQLLSSGVNEMAARLQEMHDQMARKIDEATAELRARKEEAEQANLAKSRFLAAASHDLRQPMHALGLFVTELALQAHPPAARHLVSKIAASAEAMENLLDSLLDISKLDAGVMNANVRPFALQPIFARIEAEQQRAAAAKGLRLRVRPTRAWGRSDPVLLERILKNLTSNAIRYTRTGSVMIACRMRGPHLRIEVRDSGIGIAPEERQIIFQEFVQLDNPERARDKGLGLGLAIVRRLTDLLGHCLTLHSAPAAGSTFAVELPASPPEERDHGSRGERPPGDLEGWRIALIDDDPLALAGMEGLLTAWGCEVRAAPSLEALMAAYDLVDSPPQLLISDFQLHGATTGLDAIAVMRARWGETLPAVLISGDTSADTLRLTQAAGLPLLHKPVRPGRLRALLHRMHSGLQDELRSD